MAFGPIRARGSRAQAWVAAAMPATVPPTVLDVLVAAGVCAVSLLALAASDEPGSRAVDTGAYALLMVAALPLAFRRRWPAAALGAVAAVTLISLGMGYPGGPVTVVLMAAIYVAAAAGHRRWAWLAAALFAGVGAVFRALVEGDALVAIALNSALFVLVALLGDAVYSRRALRQEVQARLRRADAERERQAQRRVLDERMRIARELHDVMAHTIATMTVQAGVAADSLDDSPEDTRKALQKIRHSARQAMAELRATVTVLRDGDHPSPLVPAPGLADLSALVESAGRDGLRVDLHAAAGIGPLAAATELTAYRIVQEAVTNVIRHADATSAVISVDQRNGELEITVDDDGCGCNGDGSVGHGLQGMRERAEAVGGRLHAGPRADGGFRVHAHLPTAGPGL